MLKYRIEVWNPSLQKYVLMSEWTSAIYAGKMFYKPYMKYQTRRLVEINTTVIRKVNAIRKRKNKK